MARLVAVKYLGQGVYSALVQRQESPEKLSGLRHVPPGSAVYREQSINVRPHEPGPDGALVVCSVPAAGISFISACIARITGGEGSQAEGREQLQSCNLKDALSHNIRQQTGNSCRYDLVWPDGCILRVNYVKKASGLAIPESLVALPYLFRQLCKSLIQRCS